MSDFTSDSAICEPRLSLPDLHRLRGIFAELARHGDSRKLLMRRGVDEGELAQASDVVAEILHARLLGALHERSRAARPTME